jgi:hypothetical protein
MSAVPEANIVSSTRLAWRYRQLAPYVEKCASAFALVDVADHIATSFDNRAAELVRGKSAVPLTM